MDKIAGLKEILALDPKNSFARYGMAMELASRGETDAALEEFDTLLANDPDYTAGYFMAAQTLATAGRTPEAIERLKAGIELRRAHRQPPCAQRDAGNARRTGPVEPDRLEQCGLLTPSARRIRSRRKFCSLFNRVRVYTIDMPKYSIVVPFHNEEENVTVLYARLKQVMEQVGDSFELVLVDDGSSDRTYKLLEEIAAVDSRVLVVKLRRNFGQTSALAAGFDHASGEFILAMDGDLQHDPERDSQLS